jgi:ferrous iron transport protein B
VVSQAVVHLHPAGALVALVGNPNCGKTALFNLLTGSRQKVANYAGVTVERKEGRLLGPAGARGPRVLDLPGAYSLYPRSPDERVTVDVLAGGAPTWWCAWSMPPTCGATCAWCWPSCARACPWWWP